MGFWLWCGFIAVGAGFIGAALNTDCAGDGCKEGSPSWLEPWTWGDYYVFPEVTVIGLVALVPATIYVILVARRERLTALPLLTLTLVLLTYPYVAGLTPQGRLTFWFGPILGVGALLIDER
jgi:hypothetical protein